MKLLVCGGMGFIGSTFIRNHLSKNPKDQIINLDNLTIGSNEKNLYDLLQELNEPDIVIVEGFKNESHPKIEIIKNPNDPSTYLFTKIENTIAIISDMKINTSISQFKNNQIEILAKFLIKKLSDE